MKTVRVLLSVTIILFFISCSSSKEARSYKKTIDGTWQVQTIITEGIRGKVKITLFEEADFNCFVGSTWSFNNYNQLGSYTINSSAECAATKQQIRWTIYEAPNEPKLLQFKKLTDKLKEMDGSGFRFNIIKLEDKSMQLSSSITFEGKSASIIYNFVRI